jgi:hypothetical protein
MSLLGPLLFGLAVAGDGASAVRVSASGQSLAVVAQGAPLSAVLEEIGRQSGTSVTYDGTAPATPLTCDFVASTPGEAFVRALQGLGLNYVLYGGTVDVPRILLISGPSAVAQTSVAAVAGARRAVPTPMVEAAAEDPDSSDEEPAHLATPPDSGAVPRRVRGRGEGQAADGRENGGSPSGGPGMNEPVERPIPPQNAAPGERAGMRGRRGQRPN